MRPILTSEEIKKVFRLAFNEINDRNDDIISWENAYKIFSDMQKESFDDFVKKQFCDKEKLQKIIDALDLKESDKERISVFLVVMTLVSQASAIKKLVQKIVKIMKLKIKSIKNKRSYKIRSFIFLLFLLTRTI